MKPLTPALEQALEDWLWRYDPNNTADFPAWRALRDIFAAYRALPAVTGPWKVAETSGGWWVERYVEGDLLELIEAPDEATAKRYALCLNVAEMNG